MRVDIGARRLAALASAGLVWCVGCTDTQAPDTDIAEMFLRSSLPGQIRSISKIAHDALAHRRSQFSEEQYAVAQQVLGDRFAPEALELSIRERLRTQPRSEYLEQALAELRTPLCEHIMRARIAFYEPSVEHETQAFFERSKREPPSPARLALIERYDAAANSAEVAAQTVLLATLSGAVLLDALRPPGERVGAEALLEMTDTNRKLLLPIFNQTSAMMSLLVFDGLTDEELENFVNFSESKIGEWHYRAISDALLDSLRDLSLGIGIVYMAALNAQPSS